MKKVERSYIREILDAINKETISFAGGLPNEELFPMNEFKKVGKKVLKDKKAFQYSTSFGFDSLRQKIANIYTEKLNFTTSKDEILITSGSQQAFDLITKLIDKKRVLLESPSYLGAINSFKILEKNVSSFDNINELEKVLNKNTFLYLISDFQNPSTKSYKRIERGIIAKHVNENNSFLIEDGAYTFLSFDNKYKTPISKYCKKSFHLGTFSKILAPGLRLGWIRADKKYIDKLVSIKEALDLHTSSFSQLLVDEYLNNNNLFTHVELLNKNYEKQMNYMAKCMQNIIPSFSFKKPKGGMFIYGSFSCDTMQLAKKALEHNVAFVPSEVFYLDKKTNEARFNFTNTSKKEVIEGLRIIADILENEKFKSIISKKIS